MTECRYVNLTTNTIVVWTNGQRTREFVVPPSGLVANIEYDEKMSGWFVPGIQEKACIPVRHFGLNVPVDTAVHYIVRESVFRDAPRLGIFRKDLVYPRGPVKGRRDSRPGHVGPYRYIDGHPWEDVQRFYASEGCYTDGRKLVDPVKCKCGTWDDWSAMEAKTVVGGLSVLCRQCGGKL